ANTVITDGDDVFVNTSGNPSLAKGGSGDVLCGIIAGLAAQDVNSFWAAVCGVYCHGYAADLMVREMPYASILASDIINKLPQVFLSEVLK
ncbi:MAG: bifunctional ADP-dependent NAD(P)H-hydrate dehydratase/NAD(P)H-hydrate epimerase, partial [Oscillospiraceae bacterium]|nr:bifunctional ADP-dependent NAD(P)H-hydrate dehydratase/NAD(P)H-hydrate epimerase [Oscillospiraceae bacterium]